MALLKKHMGYDNAYCRIHGFEIDEDSKKAVFRVKIHKKKGSPEIASKEFRIEEKDLLSYYEKEATEYIDKNVDLDKESKPLIKELNESRRRSNMPLLNPLQRKKEIEKFKNRLICDKIYELIRKKIKEFFDRLLGKGKETNIKAIGYEFLKMVPYFFESKDA